MVEMARWVSRAACIGYDPELWFPEYWNADSLRLPRQVCASCPVRLPCLQWAFDNYIYDGMWGGLTQEERRRVQPFARNRKPRMVRDVKPHGTRAAIRRHERRHEPLCAQCKATKSDLDRARSAASQARRNGRKVGT